MGWWLDGWVVEGTTDCACDIFVGGALRLRLSSFSLWYSFGVLAFSQDC